MNVFKFIKVNCLAILAVTIMTGNAHAAIHNAGRVMAIGDFDGDGRDDLAVGFPYDSPPSSHGSFEGGGVRIYFSTTATDQMPGGTPLDLYHPDFGETGGRFGASLSTGDYNNDGITDLAVGMPNKTVSGKSQAGIVYIYLGDTNHGFLSLYNNVLRPGLTETVQDDPDSSTIYTVVGSPRTNDHFGKVLASGDFDCDGADDLAVGVPEYDLNTGETLIASAGAVWALYGQKFHGVTPRSQIFMQGVGGITGDTKASDQFGFTLATGKFNSDCFEDLAVGVPFEDITVSGSAKTNAGLVNVLYGGDYFSSSPMGTKNEAWYESKSSSLVSVSDTNERFGYALAVGNFDGNSNDDLAIGVPGQSIGGHENAGAVHIIYSGSSGLAIAGDQRFHQNSGDIDGGAELNDSFGAALAAGRFNSGDTVDDLAIGVPYEDFGDDPSGDDIGVVHILFGVQDNGLTDVGPQYIHQNRSGVAGSNETHDHFGETLVTGNFNLGSGFTDIAIGAPGASGAPSTAAGKINLMRGSGAAPNALQTSNDQQLLPHYP